MVCRLIAVTTMLVIGYLHVQPMYGTTITIDVREGCAGNSTDHTATFGWMYEIAQGETLDEIRWDRINSDGTQTFILNLVSPSGTVTIAPAYKNRASTNATVSNGSAFLFLNGTTSADEGTYRCTVTDSTFNGVIDEAELGILDPPADLVQSTFIVNHRTSSSVEVEWQENPISGVCKEPPMCYVEYTMSAGPSSWETAGEVAGSDDGNETRSHNVTGLAPKTEYIIAVHCRNSEGSNNQVQITVETLEAVLITILLILLEVVGVFYSQALWVAMVMLAILGTDTCKCGTSDMVKHLACFGPLVGVLLAVLELILAFVLTKSENRHQPGFIAIVVVTAIAAGMSIIAVIAGCLFKKSGNGVCGMNFPVVTMALEFSLGLAIAVTGTVVSAVVYEEGSKEYTTGIIIGAISIALLVAAFIWFMVRVCGKRQSSKVSQDFSEARSQTQVELEHQAAQAEGDTAKPVNPPANEKEAS